MARSQQDLDWQSTKKTVLERSRHMFNNPFMSDVVFTCKGSDTKFFAHKYVLGTSSSVFYDKFYGELAEKNPNVHLSDTNEESLEEFFRFIYTDECNLTTDNVMFVLDLAKKYIVPSLAEKCIEFLEANLGVENAFTVLQQAINFDETNLAEKCWDLIDLQTSEAIASDAFVDVNQTTLAGFLKREALNVKEVDLFTAVLQWSESECLRKGIEANANNKRAAMGSAIYQIRFASMTAQQFAENVSQSGILTPEEIILMYDIISGVEKTSILWNLSERKAKEESLLRCCRFYDYLEFTMPRGSLFGLSSLKWSSTWKDTLSISFNRPVKIHGVGMLGYEKKEYNVKLEVFPQLVEKKFRPQRTSSGISGFDVMLPVPIRVQANTAVHMKSTVTGYRTFRIGSEGQKTVETKDITVTFFDTPGVRDSQTTVEQGQFNEVIFSEI